MLLLNFEKFCFITVIIHIVNCHTGYLSVKKCIVCKLLELNYNRTKSTPKNLFKMSDFWTYSINLGELIHQGDNYTYWA